MLGNGSKYTTANKWKYLNHIILSNICWLSIDLFISENVFEIRQKKTLFFLTYILNHKTIPSVFERERKKKNSLSISIPYLILPRKVRKWKLNREYIIIFINSAFSAYLRVRTQRKFVECWMNCLPFNATAFPRLRVFTPGVAFPALVAQDQCGDDFLQHVCQSTVLGITWLF